MTRTARHLLNIFVTGALAALPLAATVLVLVWTVRLLVEWLGPDSLIGGALVRIGLGVTGSEIFGYTIGVAVVLAGVFLLGLVVQTRLRHVLTAVVDGILQRIPLVRSVYDLSKRFVDLLATRDQDGLRSMSPVWLHFGGPGGAAALALLSTPEAVTIGGRSYLAVLVPTAPVPVGGGLLYVPAEWVVPAELGVDAVTSIYVSMGITSKQYLAPASG